MDFSKKKVRPKAVTPKGFRDNFHLYLKKRDEVLEVVNRIYELYGFERLETPAIETVDALGKFLPDINRPNEGVFAWQDENDSWLALRYDLTAPLARAFLNIEIICKYHIRDIALDLYGEMKNQDQIDSKSFISLMLILSALQVLLLMLRCVL